MSRRPPGHGRHGHVGDAGYEPAIEALPPDPAADPAAPVATTAILRRGEVAFVPALPVRIASILVRLGGRVESGPVATLAAGPLSVYTTIDEASAAAVAVGTVVQVFVEARGIELEGRIVELGGVAADPDTGVRGLPARIETVEPLPSDLLGADLRVTTTTAQSAGEVLVVPLAALSSSADGGEQVTVRGADRTERAVRVARRPFEWGLRRGPTAAAGTRSAPGDQVVVGR